MTTSAAHAWADEVVGRTVGALEPLEDPARAAPMAAYMRGQFPFLGVGAPARRAAQREAWRGLTRPSEPALTAATQALWTLPQREYQLAACDLLARFRAAAGPAFLAGTVEPVLTSKSWWDCVDALRGAVVGPLVAAHPQLVDDVLRRWIDSENRWLARSAIIHQLGYGAATDERLLLAFCARRAADQEFFVAKAIGWALRTHARRAPQTVRDFVTGHPELSALARREALKHL